MDFKTVQVRVEHEGFSFLTISLANFGKDLQKGLDQGYVDRRLFTGFRWKGGLPLFLGGFLDRVFDRYSGVLLEDPCIDSIIALRQLSLMFSKIALDCSPERKRAALRGFIQCEQDVRLNDSRLNPIDLEAFHRISSLLFRKMFTRIDHEVYNMEIVPKHGPGKTADGLLGNEKYIQTVWPARLEAIFPAGEFLLPNWSYYSQLDEIDILDPGKELPVKVVLVPKTMKTPRVIAMEPTCMQYAQQALRSAFYDYVKGDKLLNRMIGFDNQEPNQLLAQKGSSDGSLATLDLSEASDRVSNQLVRIMFKNHRWLNAAVDATRSRKAVVGSESLGLKPQTVRLAKYASMGSALCFPVEAMVFLTLVFLGIENSRESGTPLTPEEIKSLSGKVRVYGDDIIVPVEYVSSVVSVLETFGSVVNRGKSYWNGKFRESCGKEYFDGHDVSIVKVRQEFPTQRQDATRVNAMVELRNQLYFAGYWDTARWLDGRISGMLKHYPVVLPSSPVLGRHSFLGYETQVMDVDTHSPKVKGWVLSSRIPKRSLSDSGALLKCLLPAAQSAQSNMRMFGQADLQYRALDLPSSVDEDHLERSGRPLVVDIKLRMAPPY
jgi:hypothetical protein